MMVVGLGSIVILVLNISHRKNFSIINYPGFYKSLEIDCTIRSFH